MVDVEQIEQVFREHYGRGVAVLTRVFGDIDLAEDAVADAFVQAVRRWPADGIPPSPAGWIITTARNRAVDHLRREATRPDREQQAAAAWTSTQDETARPGDAIPDDRLRLIFTCAHPALAMPARVALTLRLVGGLSTREIARSFLVSESTMAQRLVRAKAKIRAAGIPYRVPAAPDLPARMDGVLTVLYLVFNEGYTASSGDHLVRTDLCVEAIRLSRLTTALLPDEPEVTGLLALMLLAEARRPARASGDGRLVPLARQDRALWNRELIAEGHALVRACLDRNRPGRYQIQAAINAVHTAAATAASTDWGQIVALYDLLRALDPSPVVALHRAVAVAEVAGPAAALDIVDGLDLTSLHLYHAIRADLLCRLDRLDDATHEYDAAIVRTENRAEREFLRSRRAQLAAWRADTASG